MKQPLKPTSAQKKTLSFNNLDCSKYLTVGAVKNGWLFIDRDDSSKMFVCYPKQKGIYDKTGENLIDFEE